MNHHSHHDHSHSLQTGKKLLWTVGLNISITIFQITGGILSNSLSLLTDALHNLGDSLSLVMAYFAHRWSRKDPSPSKTFGYKRLQIMATFLNSLILIVFSLFIIRESVDRLWHPEKISEGVVFVVALAGFLFNGFSLYLLHSEQKESMNIKAAYIHLFGDMAVSLGVMVGAIGMYFFRVFILDAILSMLIGIWIIYSAIGIFQESVRILLQFAPRGLDVAMVRAKVESFPEVANMHHLHVWQLDDDLISMECHIDLKKDIPVSQTHKLKETLSATLEQDFHINHFTFQFEYGECPSKDLIYKPLHHHS